MGAQTVAEPFHGNVIVFAGMTGSMGAEEWRRVRELLHRALELEPGQRPAYLDEACGGDAELRAEVDSLLAASERSAFIDEPALPAIEALRPGQTVAHYRVEEKIGEGGMGAVYRAVDVRLGRTVALKVISPERRAEKSRFAREAKAASALNHPNIVTIYEFNSEGDLDFIAMEYIQGATLQTLLSEQRVPREMFLEYARQAAVALAKAHAAGIVHRDLKPSNIMVTADGTVKVLDFGLAKRHEPASAALDASQTQSVTREGVILGTPAYMSPEQALGEPTDWRSDIFSFGVILYEITYGRRPFRGNSRLATLYQIAHEEPMVAGELPLAPPELRGLIERCLRKEPSERPQSMMEVAAALARAEHPSTATVEKPPRQGISRRRVAGASAFAVAALSAGWWASRKEQAPAAPERVLRYELEAQRMRDGRPLGAPYATSATESFQGGWKFRLRAQSPQKGYLYLINQGPGAAGADRFWILYPTKPGAAAVAPNEELKTGWYVFDRNPGTERLWIVWSGRALDAVENALSGSAGGRVDSPDAAASLQHLVSGLSRGQRAIAPDRSHGIELSGRAEALGDLLPLQHR